jgi:PhnB protein
MHSTKVSAIPEGYNTVTPYLIIDGAAKAIEFYQHVFGASELMRMDAPGGRVGHAELKIGDSKIMLADECPEMNASSPKKHGGSPVTLHLYVENVDAVAEKAVKAGATLTGEITDKFYGDRSGSLEDPFGHVWHIATHIEDVTPEETQKRAEKLFSQ